MPGPPTEFHGEGPAALNRVSILAVVIGFLAIGIDGFDNYIISYAAPFMTREWGITDKSVLGPVFSAGLIGAAIGAMWAGYAASRVGARTVVVACCILLAVPSLLMAFATSLSQMVVLRLLVGLGIGGLQPVLLALTSEHVPARYRATMVTVMWSGITVGAAMAGVAGTWIIPEVGWRAVFLGGGVCALAIGLLCLLLLPEAPSFTAARARKRSDEDSSGKLSLKDSWMRTIQGRLLVLTPLLWILHGGLLVAYYGIANWLPTLLATLGRPPSDAGSFGMIFQIGGTIGGVAMSWLIDRGRLGVLSWAVVPSIPLVALIGFVAGHDMLLYAAVFAAGFSIISVTFASNAIATMTYEPTIRPAAMGYYFVSGRVIGAVGPMLISLGLWLGIQPRYALIVVCIPLGASLAAAIGIARYRNEIYGETAAR